MKTISKLYFSLVGLIWHPSSSRIQRQLEKLINDSNDIQSVKIGPCRTWLLSLLLPFLAAGMGAYLIDPQFNTTYGIIGAILGFVLSILLMLKFRTTMEVTKKGFELTRGRSSVSIPWNVLNSKGGAGSLPNWKLVLSSQPEFYSQIQYHLDGELVETGRMVKTDFFKVLEQSQIEFDNGFGMFPAHLSGFLLQLAGEFQGAVNPENVQSVTQNELPSTNEDLPPQDDIVYIDPQGKLVIGISHVRFPELCFSCNGTPETMLPLQLKTTGREAIDNRSFEVSLPTCKKCKKLHRFQMLNGSFTLWGGVGLILSFLYVLLFGYLGIHFDKMWYMPLVAAFLTTFFLRFKIGRIRIYLFTKAGGNCSLKKRTVSLKLKNTSFAKAKLKHILETT